MPVPRIPGSGAYARAFPTGTLMVFQQSAAPTGWTKQATHNDKALRVVTGSASSGGATAFTSVFGSGKTTGSTTLTTSHLPASGLTVSGSVASLAVYKDSINAGGSTLWSISTSTNLADTSLTFPIASSSISGTTSNMGTGNGHTHTESLDLHYVDVIIAAKV